VAKSSFQQDKRKLTNTKGENRKRHGEEKTTKCKLNLTRYEIYEKKYAETGRDTTNTLLAMKKNNKKTKQTSHPMTCIFQTKNQLTQVENCFLLLLFLSSTWTSSNPFICSRRRGIGGWRIILIIISGFRPSKEGYLMKKRKKTRKKKNRKSHHKRKKKQKMKERNRKQ
jgi:hypothetical protein